jgi:small-conductance mechanosensitive channel
MIKIKAWTTGRRWLLLLLGLIFSSLVLFGYLTRGGDTSLEYNAPAAMPSTGGLVDQTPLSTARSLASLSSTAQEHQYADQALAISDHEVDQAFATAVRQATAEAPALSPAAQKLSQRISVLDARVKSEKQTVEGLEKALSTAADQASAQEDLDEANAQLALDSNELDDLHEDFTRAGGGKSTKLQEALVSRQQIQKNEGQVSSSTAALETPAALRTLPGKIRAYLSLNDRLKRLAAAQQEALHAVIILNQQHEALETAIEKGISAISNTNSSGGQRATPGTDTRQATIASMQKISGQRKALVEYDKRIHDEQQLAEIYKNWGDLVVLQRTTVLHRIIRVLNIVVALIIVAIIIDAVISRFFTRFGTDVRRIQHLHLVTDLVIQIVFLGMILIVVFGPPPQLSTVIGLATAGLTFVLKDFIIAICGWFVLVGRNGVRVGDLVEINGVAGEIIKVGLFRTVLLETGNWTAAGHPTGRRVTFFNGFAIEGQYFNFSTAGQWLWDEVKINVPVDDNLQEDTERIIEIINHETGNATRQAEKEWASTAGSYALKNFSAAPNVSLKPAGSTIELTVRYVTRASERLATRSRIYQKLIEALQAKAVAR